MSNLNKHLNASQEEFEEGAATPQEEWIDLPDTSLSDVHEGVETQEALTQLATRVEATSDGDQPALESFNWTYRTLTRLTGLTPRVYPALEDFNDDPTLQRSVLAKSIRKHADRLGRAITLSIEDYTESFGHSLQQLVESIKASQGDLKRSLTRIDDLPSKTVKVNHGKVWAMLHVNGKFAKDLDQTVANEQRNIKELLAVAKQAASAVTAMSKETEAPSADGVEAAMNRGGNFELMFNTSVSFGQGQVDFERATPPSPKTEKIGTDYLRGAGWGTLFGLILLGPAFLLGTIIGTLGSSATGRTSNSKRDTDGIKGFLADLGNFAKFADEIESIAEELNSAVKASEAHATVVKRAAAPVMELMSSIAKHVAELCYGGASLGSALASASK